MNLTTRAPKSRSRDSASTAGESAAAVLAGEPSAAYVAAATGLAVFLAGVLAMTWLDRRAITTAELSATGGALRAPELIVVFAWALAGAAAHVAIRNATTARPRALSRPLLAVCEAFVVATLAAVVMLVFVGELTAGEVLRDPLAAVGRIVPWIAGAS